MIKSYERLWAEQEQTRREFERHRERSPESGRTGLYTSPEIIYEGYPTHWLGDDLGLIAAPGAVARLDLLLALPLVTHAAWARHTDPALLRTILAAADGTSLAELERLVCADR